MGEHEQLSRDSVQKEIYGRQHASNMVGPQSFCDKHAQGPTRICLFAPLRFLLALRARPPLLKSAYAPTPCSAHTHICLYETVVHVP